jgi:Lar family restriction alleviation protein
MTDTLKPCPFCGGPAKILALGEGDDGVWAVECAARKQDGHFAGVHSEERADAIDAWNRRTP